MFTDLPQVPPGAMGRFFLTMMAAVAEFEAGLTSERTRAALAQPSACWRCRSSPTRVSPRSMAIVGGSSGPQVGSGGPGPHGDTYGDGCLWPALGTVGEIISEWWATSSRNQHLGKVMLPHPAWATR